MFHRKLRGKSRNNPSSQSRLHRRTPVLATDLGSRSFAIPVLVAVLLAVLYPLGATQTAVSYPMRPGSLRPQAVNLILFVGLEVTLEPIPVGGILFGPLPG